MDVKILRALAQTVAVICVLNCAVFANSGPSEAPKGDSLDRIASRYQLIVLRSWKLDPLPRQMYGIYARAPEHLEAQASRLPQPTIAGLRAEISQLQSSLASARGSRTRRDWIAKHLIAIDTRLRLLAGERLSLREEARLLFDLELTAISLERLKIARAELEHHLPGPGSTHERLRAWTNATRIQPDLIEIAVRLALEESRRRTLRVLRLPARERVTLKFERAVPYGGWAEPLGGGHTVLHINLDRSITLGWLTHFIAHEGYPGHHVALTLLEQTAKRFPERRLLPPLSPSNTLLEGGADAVAAALWTDDETFNWMRRVLLPAIGMTQFDLDLWRRLQPNVETVQTAVLHIPFLLDQGTIGDEILDFLEHDGLFERDLAEALVADARDSPFPQSFGLISAKRSPAAQLARTYLGSGPPALRQYVRFWTTPLTPADLRRGFPGQD